MVTRTRWVKAGVRADADAAAKARRERNRSRADRERRTEEARQAWDRGALRPWLITMALDMQGLDGPEVDIACGVEEPAVDMWEAGELYPTWEQLLALADLTGMYVWWFFLEHRPPTGHTTQRFHDPEWEPPAPPLLRFQTAAVERTVGHPIGRNP
jgi:hypothetical protein